MVPKMRAIERSRSGESQLTEIHKVLPVYPRNVQAVKNKVSEIKSGALVPLWFQIDQKTLPQCFRMSVYQCPGVYLE